MRTNWEDARVNKPKCIDPVLVCTSDGLNHVAQWDGYKWTDANTGDDIGGVEYFYDYTLPAGWKISDSYYEDRPEYVPYGYTAVIREVFKGVN